MRIHDLYNPLFEKMSLVVNRTLSKGAGRELQESGLLERLPCDGVIGETALFRRKVSILRAGNMLIPVFQPLLNRLVGVAKEQ